MKLLCKVDIDKLISGAYEARTLYLSPFLKTHSWLRTRPGPWAARTASSRVTQTWTQMLNLRDVVRHLPALQKALVGSKSELLCIICDVRYRNPQVFTLYRCPSPLHPQMLSDERLAKIERLVSNSLNEGVSLQKVRPCTLPRQPK